MYVCMCVWEVEVLRKYYENTRLLGWRESEWVEEEGEERRGEEKNERELTEGRENEG